MESEKVKEIKEALECCTNNKGCESCPVEWKNCPGCEFYSTNTGCCMNNVDRPPQSYMYVEEV